MRKKKPQALARGLRAAAEFLLDKSQEIVPVDTGELKESGHVEGSRMNVAVVYDADHAVIVHEDLAATHTPPTSAKYLEIPARANRKEMREIIREEVDRT
jgi:hypothetical protein